MKTNDTIPVVGKKYKAYQAGKIKLANQFEVLITEIIPFNQADEAILKEWKSRLLELELLAEYTDFFIKAKTYNYTQLFVRTKDNQWYSTYRYGFGGLLDVDGTLTSTVRGISVYNYIRSMFIDKKINVWVNRLDPIEGAIDLENLYNNGQSNYVEPYQMLMRFAYIDVGDAEYHATLIDANYTLEQAINGVKDIKSVSIRIHRDDTLDFID